MSATKNPDGEFAYGSGHVNPVKGADPGLIFVASKKDYIKFLCGLGYDQEMVRQISGDDSSCPRSVGKSIPNDDNYPYLAFEVKADESFNTKFHRTVTNVGIANSTGKAKVDSSYSKSESSIRVEPEVLSFKLLNEKKSFEVIVAGAGVSFGSRLSASLICSDRIRSVRSPVIVYAIKLWFHDSVCC
ncbi:hypothetical protein Nepgr_009277 [Nepenthes gracilis]|uniref:Subtilisin-like protease fibronectin type-III domain-containing protein n=1 Tax=Nepenthes gracilis TaxID=150966 RepID=A0AAD3XK05_NEPGR|nr:hypothetical protein Nepgr_009277 [Nepenthes gracilis]